MRVDIGVACSGAQTHNWWLPIMGQLLAERDNGINIGEIIAVSSAIPDFNKNAAVGSLPFWKEEEKKRADLTDANRMEISGRFLEGSADYLFFLDDDTVHPPGTLTHLLSLGRDFVAGLYFNPRPPFNPIAYYRNENGTYHPLYGYAPGTLVQVDSVGMGCTLIHRSVFEKIMEAHTVFQRSNGSMFPVWNERISEQWLAGLGEEKLYLNRENGEASYVLPATRIEVSPNDNRNFPFFAMEYGRTEDHHFCELAAHVGIRPWVDTNVKCSHWKYQGTTYADYKRYIDENRDKSS